MHRHADKNKRHETPSLFVTHNQGIIRKLKRKAVCAIVEQIHNVLWAGGGEGAHPPTQGWVLDSCTFAADTPPS